MTFNPYPPKVYQYMKNIPLLSDLCCKSTTQYFIAGNTLSRHSRCRNIGYFVSLMLVCLPKGQKEHIVFLLDINVSNFSGYHQEPFFTTLLPPLI